MIQVRPWWKRFFLGLFKYSWVCPVCEVQKMSDREDLIIWMVLEHEKLTHGT